MGRKVVMGRAGAERIGKALGTKFAFSEPDDSMTVVLTEPKGTVSFDRATFIHHGVKVLDDFELTVESGSFVTILASQSTGHAMTNVLTRQRQLSSGAVQIDGTDLCTLTLESLRSTLLVAEHDAVLFKGSLRENLAFTRANISSAEIDSVLEAIAAGDILDSLRGGLDGAVSERGRSLSGGQRQRVALARALLFDPPILVLVDPTSALDSFTESEILRALPRWRQGRTTMVFSSSPALLQASESVIIVEDGRVAARGTHQELLEHDHYRRQFVWS